jgi:maltose alpha-D-glucosyltransferase/alpha-amylase
VLKLFRRIEPGPNPDFEIGRFLAERRFARCPMLLGALEYNRPGVEPGTLAVVQTVVKHQGSGWDYTIDELRRYYERVAARMRRSNGMEKQNGQAGQEGPFFDALEQWYLASAATLGRRTAELHLVLTDSTEPAFAPEPLDADALGALADGMLTHAQASFDLLESRLATLNDPTRAQAEAVLADRTKLLTRFEAVRGLGAAGLRIRIHGDYHLGQVLRTEEDFAILDFEGEPARSVAERRAKHSPLKDVAGMIRSYSYAAYAALFASTLHAPDDLALLEPWADTWQRGAATAFLREYRATIGGTPLSPPETAFSTLLCAFVLDKALYELAYELNNRPDWVRIPLVGILKLR